MVFMAAVSGCFLEIDEVVEDLVERLPARLFHPLLQPVPRFEREASADAGEVRSFSAGPYAEVTSIDDVVSNMSHV